jgi:hypothetical protein
VYAPAASVADGLNVCVQVIVVALVVAQLALAFLLGGGL